MFTILAQTDVLAVVALSGRIDSHSSALLEKEFDQLLREGHRWLVLDFAAVTLLASAGLRLLLRAESVCKQNQGALVLAAVPKPVDAVLQLAGFAPHFQHYPDVDTARSALENPEKK